MEGKGGFVGIFPAANRGQKRNVRVVRICRYRFASCVLFVLFSLCGERLVFVGLFLFRGIVMQFVGERRSLLGGSAVKNPGGCGALTALTDEEGNFLWLEGGEGESVEKAVSGADFYCRLFWMGEYFFCF